MNIEDAHRLVVQHLSDAYVTSPPGASDLQLANYILSRWGTPPRRPDARRDAVRILGDEVRKLRAQGFLSPKHP